MQGHESVLGGLFEHIGSAARYSAGYAGRVAQAAKEKVAHAISEAKSHAAKQLFAKPAGAAIEPCPKNKKAERVAERKAKLAAGKEQLQAMPPGRHRDALAQATERFERNNVAVERARLAEDAYKVGQGEPPEGWERVGGEELRRLGVSPEMFPQSNPKFRPSEYKDGYYPELYRAKPGTFGREHYVLSFRGTQGVKDGATDVNQAFGGETDHYSRAIKTAQRLKAALGGNVDITGHSMGGGMATAAGIVAGIKVFAFDPAGIHPNTVEHFGQNYYRDAAKLYVENYVAEGEILDAIQAPGTQRTILAGTTLMTPIGGGAVAFGGRRALMDQGTVTYGAAGPVYRLPILVNAEDILDGNSQHGVLPGLGGRMANSINPIRKIKLHDPKYIIAGLEQQKADDLHMLKRMVL